MTLFEWLFRNRRTGQITIGQWPNAAAKTTVVSGIVHWLFPDDLVGKFARVISVGSLVIWALQELLGGVNPARRMNGLSSLVLLARRLLR